MKYFAAVALLAFAACSHTSPPPPAFGFHGVIRPHHDVACVIDDEMSVEQCDQVALAVDKINAAVGYELLAPPRHTTVIESRQATPETETIFVGVTTLQPGVLGVTYLVLYEKETGNLRLEVVVFDPEIFKDPVLAASVILHEMTHAVGATHAAQTGPFDSVMKPVWEPGAPVELTPADVAALRAAYAK